MKGILNILRTLASKLAAGDLFLVALQPFQGKDRLVGYICGTLSASATLTHDSMSRHASQGTSLCIHSVCVDRMYRRNGIARRMLLAYLSFVQQTNPQVGILYPCSDLILAAVHEMLSLAFFNLSPFCHGI